MRKITKSFAMQIIDYIIANWAIADGLCSSIILNLRLRDFEEWKSIEEYPGHKVITNDVYKTSSIYRDKFILTAAEHCEFYIQHLLKIATNVKSLRVSLAASSQSKLMQTNVTSSITSIFKTAYVFSPNEGTVWYGIFCEKIHEKWRRNNRRTLQSAIKLKTCCKHRHETIWYFYRTGQSRFFGW